MRKAFRHTGLLMLMGVVALGLVGAAYTLWYEDLDLEATVATGTFNVDWSIEEPGQMPVVSTDLGATWREFTAAESLKRVDCGIDIADNPEGANDQGDKNVLLLKLAKLYPYSGCEFWLDIHNSGTTPAHLTFIGRRAEGTPDLGPWMRFALGPNSNPLCEGVFNDAAQPGTEVPRLQLHEGERIVCHVIIWVTETDAAGNVLPEGALTQLQWRWKAHQWNEKVGP